MNGPSSSVPPTFPFPFTPYDIQSQFMNHLYKTLEEGKIGIFESPTGTGKSLSLICGAVTWLKDYERRKKTQLEEQIAMESDLQDDETDWFASFAKKKERMEKIREAKSEIEYLKKQEKRFSELKQQMKRKRSTRDPDLSDLSRNSKYAKDDQCDDSIESTVNDDDIEILLGDYASDEENRDEDTEVEEKKDTTKIYYCSRTHSQLSQFVREVQRSPYSSDIRVVSLGSRQNMCINETVQKLKNLSLMNEKCLDMQKGKKSAKGISKEANILKETVGKQSHKTCPFHKHSVMEEMRDHIFIEVKDIEQIVEMGKQRKACPYYSTRYGVNEAELVVMPYNMLLHKATRNACGITLKGNIVIIDEAHNLLETINNIHSSIVTGEQLANAYSQLDQYLNRFRSRLHPKNLMYVKQILFLLSAFIKHLGGNVDTVPTDALAGEVQVGIYSHNDFLSVTEIDNINLFKILKYCEKSQISHKLHGFVGKYQVTIHKKNESNEYMQSSILDFLSKILNKDVDDATTASTAPEDQLCGSPFVFFQEFLRCLTNPSRDGRILSQKQETLRKSSLKFILLNPAVQFQEIVSECRSIIVAGGTMQPTSDFVDQLFIPSGAEISRITHFSCGHVIAPENLLGIALSHGPSGKPLDFTFQCRDTTEVIDELGRTLLNVCTIVPAGVVCFFPSYEYEQKVHEHWEKSGFTYKLNGKKRIFREPKKASLLEQVLAEYSRASTQKRIYSKQPNGAILFCVVGGKMSEGINFSDDLGRAVIMVGLPYPNVNSPELREKMNYLNKIVPKVADGKLSGQVYYENICMKAVNQSIGRAVRHKEDYAIILLLDGRYLRPSVTSALPVWISVRLTSYPKFNHAFAAIRQFFADKKKSSAQENVCT